MEIVKRPATLSDSKLILTWRNSSSARNVSQSTNELSEAEHEKWFQSRINRFTSEPFWIMSKGEKDVGFVRLDFFDIERDTFTVSIFVDPEFRSVGFGKQMLGLALNFVNGEHANYQYRAVIKKDNLGSLRLFKSFGFELFKNVDNQFDEYRVTPRQRDPSAPSI
jgi:spore coat polysaccharide biosynthesis protein SpsF